MGHARPYRPKAPTPRRLGWRFMSLYSRYLNGPGPAPNPFRHLLDRHGVALKSFLSHSASVHGRTGAGPGLFSFWPTPRFPPTDAHPTGARRSRFKSRRLGVPCVLCKYNRRFQVQSLERFDEVSPHPFRGQCQDAPRSTPGQRQASPPLNLKPAVGLSTDFTDFTDGLEPEAPPLRRFHVTRRVKRQPLNRLPIRGIGAICGSNRLF